MLRDGAKKLGAAETGSEGSGASGRGEFGVVDDEKVLLRQVIDAKSGAVGDVAQEAKIDHEGASVQEGHAHPRCAKVGEAFANSNAGCKRVLGERRGEEDSGAVVVRIVGSWGGRVGIGMKHAWLEAGGGKVTQERRLWQSRLG